MESQSHWVNNFWGQDDAGYRRLMHRIHCAKQTCDELRAFYKERFAIEQEYAKKLNSLSRKALGSNETGGMKQSFETVRSTTKATAASHETVARQLNEQLIAPLDAFTSSMKGRAKTVEDTMGQLTRAKSSQNHSSEKARNRYVAECNKISGYQAQQNLLMGRELDKNNQKLDKAAYQVEGLQRQYQDGLKALAQIMENWNAEWRVSCDKLEQIEDERLGFLKSNLWAYANSISAACVADDEACETVRLSLERCDPAKDLEDFSREYGTGSRIQDPPEFVNFLQGFSREADDDDGHYHIANFDSSLNDNAIPDLGISSAAGNYLDGQSANVTPMSSPGTLSLQMNQDDHYERVKQDNLASLHSTALDKPASTNAPESFKQEPKKRRSWAMPFKRKSNPEQPINQSSALDQPSFSGPAKFEASQQVTKTQPPAQQSTDARRRSWAPNTATSSNYSTGPSQDDASQDPLLSALERLKTPNLKPRPKSMGQVTNSSGGPPSPYGNGNPTHFTEAHNTQEIRRKPVHRKQVGSTDSVKYPVVTSDGRRVIRHSRAQFDYRAAIPEEVTFRKGDLLLITEMQEDGWWDCEVAGRNAFGLAPSNFLVDATS